MEAFLGFLSQLGRMSQPVWLAVALASGFVLIGPGDTLQILRIDEFRDANGPTIGIVFVFSTSLSIVVTFQWLSARTAAAWQWYKKRSEESAQAAAIASKREGYLQNLTPHEKEYLRPFVFADVNTQYWSLRDGIAGGLEAKKIIWMSSSAGDLVRMAYNIHPWAKDALRARPELLAAP